MKQNISRPIKLLFITFIFPYFAHSQELLEKYIEEGLSNNQVLFQKNISLEKALIGLKIAKSNFLPSVNFSGSYSTAQGGRYTDLPIGDMINPVYTTLNQLTNSNNFPQLENQQIDFLPKNYYDVYVRTSMPLFNSDFIYSKRIESQKIQLEAFQVQIYMRELVKNIKISYYNYLSAAEAVKVYENAVELVQKNVDLNQSLLKNGKGLNASLLRAESELSNVNALLNDAKNQLSNAQNYFNFLLNRPLNSTIEIEPLLMSSDFLATKNQISQVDSNRREELLMIQQVSKIQSTAIDMHKKYWVPKVNAFLDLGSQAVNMEFSNKSRYYMVGVNVGIPIFNGYRNAYKSKLSMLDLKSTEANYKYVALQLQLSASASQNNLSTVIQNYEASLQRNKSAEKYFELIERGLQEGVNSQIEFIDANNQLTSARLQVTLNGYKILIAKAELERETATYPIQNSIKP